MTALRAPLLGLLLVACGSTESGTDDSHATSSSTTATSSSTSTTTGHDHVTGTSSTTTGGDSLAGDYCDCMLLYCHDQYHDAWGEEHPMSETNCLAAAEALPTIGAPAMSGDSLECRLHHCQAASDGDPAACQGAIGGPPCQ